MSLKQAKQVSVSMKDPSHVPPPRRIDDVLSMLEQAPSRDPERLETWRQTVNASPDPDADDRDLAAFYFRRSAAATRLGDHHRCLEDVRKALHHAEKEGMKDDTYYVSAALNERIWGNYLKANHCFEQAKRINRDNPFAYSELVSIYKDLGSFEMAKRVGEEGKHRFDMYYKFPVRDWQWYRFFKACESSIDADLCEIEGNYKQAEPHRRSAILHAAKFNASFLGKKTAEHGGTTALIVPYLRFLLARNLMVQDRMLDAELEARLALKEAVETFGTESAAAGLTLAFLGQTLLEQGRLSSAERLMQAGIATIEDSGISHDSFAMGKARSLFAGILLAKGDGQEAMRQYDRAQEEMASNRYLYHRFLAGEPAFMACLLKTGRAEEAVRFINVAYNANREAFGEGHYLTAETQGLRAVAHALAGRSAAALRDYAESVPILIRGIRGREIAFLKRRRVDWIVRSYIDLLVQTAGTPLEAETGLDAKAEAFRWVDALGGRSVRMALGASTARAAVSDPVLADLVRKEQDLSKQLKVVQEALANNLAIAPDQQIAGVKEDLRQRLDRMTRAKDTLLREIKARFPKYADFIDPPPVTWKQVQRHLRSGEAFVSIFTSESSTHVWAVPKEGLPSFRNAPLGRKQIEHAVRSLRKALDPNPVTFGGIPEFDLASAHDLYDKLLRPVEGAWKGARDLLVAVQGPLGRLPLSVLPTASCRPGPESDVLFENYRKIPWLIRRVSITRQPSASSFVAQRALENPPAAEKPFAGFGDPVYHPRQLAKAGREDSGEDLFRGGTRRPRIRGIRKTLKGDLDSQAMASVHLGQLNRLPDTADEIRRIAIAVGADPAQDVFLGKDASERQVKRLDLSNRRVIAFASHALVPGDLDGLDQPAIALSAPSVTGDHEDGLLTMKEVLKLNLNADWVVLSGCNTGAADAAGSEALSGLVQAFFYAGTRAVLASMWPVETTSAHRLTTRLFEAPNERPGLSRARAHQDAMLDLMDHGVLEDNVTGNIIASYAHPLFWAPFLVVGDGT